jgi:cell division protein FtsN
VSESDASRAIQTGSFRDAENAAYMSRELEREGFTSVVVQADVGGRLYYRVLVPVAFGESEQELLLRLKEKGFEGNPVY